MNIRRFLESNAFGFAILACAAVSFSFPAAFTRHGAIRRGTAVSPSGRSTRTRCTRSSMRPMPTLRKGMDLTSFRPGRPSSLSARSSRSSTQRIRSAGMSSATASSLKGRCLPHGAGRKLPSGARLDGEAFRCGCDEMQLCAEGDVRRTRGVPAQDRDEGNRE